MVGSTPIPMSSQQAASAPTVVRRAYARSVQSRQHWHGLDARFRDESLRKEAHADLQESTLNWFEALAPYMADSQGAVKEFWTRAPLWPTKQATEVIGLECPRCGAFYDVDVEEVEDATCVNVVSVQQDDGEVAREQCGAEATPKEVVATDEEGRTLYEWAQGLRLLNEWEGETEVVTQRQGTFKPTSKTIEKPKLIEPAHLLRIARYLDQVAERKDLLAETTDETPTAQLELQSNMEGA